MESLLIRHFEEIFIEFDVVFRRHALGVETKQT